MCSILDATVQYHSILNTSTPRWLALLQSLKHPERAMDVHWGISIFTTLTFWEGVLSLEFYIYSIRHLHDHSYANILHWFNILYLIWLFRLSIIPGNFAVQCSLRRWQNDACCSIRNESQCPHVQMLQWNWGPATEEQFYFIRTSAHLQLWKLKFKSPLQPLCFSRSTRGWWLSLTLPGRSCFSVSGAWNISQVVTASLCHAP